MKYIKSLFSILMVLSLCVFTSCEQENEGTIYNAKNQGLSFTFNSFEFSAPANNPIISVPVYRAEAGEAFTSSITVSAEAGVLPEGTTLSVTQIIEEAELVELSQAADKADGLNAKSENSVASINYSHYYFVFA